MAVPELPDVEMRKKYLERTALGRKIEKADVLDERMLDGVTPERLREGLAGARFDRAERRAKYLVVLTDRSSTVLIHFGMTGDLALTPGGEPAPRFARVRFVFEGGDSLDLVDQRLFGKVALHDTADWSGIPEIARLGPEPLGRGFTLERFREIVSSRNTTVHQLLMDQELIAGIGNIYSDEICYQAGVRPDRRTGSLSGDEVKTVYDKTKWVLRRAIRLDADLDAHADVFLIPNRGRGGTCPGTREELQKKTIGGRTSWFCPSRQR